MSKEKIDATACVIEAHDACLEYLVIEGELSKEELVSESQNGKVTKKVIRPEQRFASGTIMTTDNYLFRVNIYSVEPLGSYPVIIEFPKLNKSVMCGISKSNYGLTRRIQELLSLKALDFSLEILEALAGNSTVDITSLQLLHKLHDSSYSKVA